MSPVLLIPNTFVYADETSLVRVHTIAVYGAPVTALALLRYPVPAAARTATLRPHLCQVPADHLAHRRRVSNYANLTSPVVESFVGIVKEKFPAVMLCEPKVNVPIFRFVSVVE